MKKLLLTLAISILATTMFGQAYRSLSIAPLEYNTHESHSGIVSSITPQSDGSYLVSLFNSNYNDDGNTRTSHHFYWYLSYKGKRVSDYYNNTIRCRKSEEVAAFAWPNEVPKGNERYVTVQLGKEPRPKDRRDDY